MRFRVDIKQLARVLKTACGVVGNTTISPLLSNCALSADAKSGTLTVAATDIELFASASCDAQVDESGSILANPSVLANVVGKRGFADFETTSDYQIKIRVQGGATSNVFGLSPDDFPEFPALGETKFETTIEADVFEDVVRRVAYAISPDESKPNLCGVRLHERDGETFAIATDGRRLALVPMSCAPVPCGIAATLPTKIVAHVVKLGRGRISARFSKNQCEFSAGGVKFLSRLIEGAFPDFDAVIPQTRVATIRAPREALRAAFESVAIFARDNAHTVRLSLMLGLPPEITAHSAKSGSSIFVLDFAEYVGEDNVPLKIAYNGLFASEAIGAIKADDVEIRFTGPGTATLFLDRFDPGARHVLMPMRSL